MSIDYNIYSSISETELEERISSFISESSNREYFSSFSTRKINEFTKEILSEMGYNGDYASTAFIRVNKDFIVEATNALKELRDKKLRTGNNLFLLNDETELSE